MSTKRIIKIKKGNYSTDELKLSDSGHTKAGRKDAVIWRIKGNSNVASITAIEKKPKSREIFSTLPHAQGGCQWKGIIAGNAPYTEYEYSIHWKGTDGSCHEYDPKIAVNPDPHPSHIVLALFAACIGALWVRHEIRRNHSREEI